MLHLYYGSDSYRLRAAVTERIAALRSTHGPSMLLTTVDCTTDDAGDALARPLKYPAFFGEKQILVAYHAVADTFADTLKQYDLTELNDIVVLAVQDTTGLRGTKALTALQKSADTAESFEPLSGAQLSAWITSYATSHGATLGDDARSSLIGIAGSDTSLIAQELDKLCAYAQGRPIDAAMVNLLSPKRVERDEWELSNALAAHDKRGALVALWKRLSEGAPEPLVLGSVAAGVRNLLMVKDLNNRRQPTGSIAKLTGLHPFVISKTLKGASAADAERIRTALVRLAQLDRSGKDGRTDVTDGLFGVLLAL